MNSKSSNQTCYTILIINTYPKNKIYHNIQYIIMQKLPTIKNPKFSTIHKNSPKNEYHNYCKPIFKNRKC